MPSIPNDEPVYDDRLNHFVFVRQLAQMMIECEPPYVIGVCGSWGSGKTSFLRKLWACLGGECEAQGNNDKERDSWRKALRQEWLSDDFKSITDGCENWDVIWFNPWHHQFEASPLVALLQEIRQHFCLSRKVLDEAGKLVNVATYSALNMLTEVGKTIKVPLPNAKETLEYGNKYEAERFSTTLSSQNFRQFFEDAVATAIESKRKTTRSKTAASSGRLVIFIDDLDRCEGDVAYRLLESLKLYLNAKNCIYVLGLDQEHLEETVARVIANGSRPRARNYLNKMFQNLFLLPIRKDMSEFVRAVLAPDAATGTLLQARFGMTSNEWPEGVVQCINTYVPHNPRKIKAFVSAWRLYLKLLAQQRPKENAFNWKLTLILNYLGQFEEPLFRKVEEAPGFYSDQIVPFCLTGTSTHPLFEGLELPYGTQASPAVTTGGYDTPPPATGQEVGNAKPGATDAKPSSPPRVFWVAGLITSLGSQGTVDVAEIEKHLLGTAALLSPAAQS